MSATGRGGEATVEAVESAGFVRIVARADGDSLAAAGVLARAISDREIPFQVGVDRTVADRTERVAEAGDSDDATTIAVGAVDAETPRLESSDRPVTLEACDLARALGADPDPLLALAGAFAAGVEPGAGETEHLLETARERGLLERRPGLAIPTDDVEDVAASTLVRAPWSGDREAIREAFESVGDGPEDETRRRAGSLVALEAVGAGDAGERAAHAIGRALHPYATPEGPFATVGGYADVLESTARSRPGTGIALAIGHDVREAALDVWRDHGVRAHRLLEAASTGRYDGLYVVGVEGAVETVARVAAAYRSPEPVVLAIGDEEAGIAVRTARGLDGSIEAIARELGAAYDVGRRRGYLRYGPELNDSTIISAVRERL